MKWIALVLAGVLLGGCALAGQSKDAGDIRGDLWAEAHQALGVEDFSRAAALFQRLASEHGSHREGREALFFLGSMRLDPRNPAWDPKPAEDLLRRYLAQDSIAGAVVIGRRPEAETFVQLAAQLNMPPQERLPALQPETQVIVRTRPQRVVVPARESRELAGEVARLRRELAERESTIQTQREELERIRKTLTGRGGR